ncbi:metalloregulator ArsR/SmtB family transcription factor [Arsukibacterium indicum]|uniref:Metalloregulator ArsR/SmtB family transcription factor n=1 Tax=Arsukibacterium indicum TaxID=2848612 RepID=A0ABS6MQ00_9GAMM|nr:metalloregulator ArsR/SmtB family transcription factor [Arsukibacterium indicum]MBV2130810.1 metalloregulator ArsR/SmtB family transcription factor [Arsukibacterium indicum]
MLCPVTFYKALADDTRLKSLLLITEQQELCVCELMTALELSQPKISRHLAQLRKANVLADRRSGQWVFYSLHPALPTWAQQVLKQTLLANELYLAPCRQQLSLISERAVTQSCC